MNIKNIWIGRTILNLDSDNEYKKDLFKKFLYVDKKDPSIREGIYEGYLDTKSILDDRNLFEILKNIFERGEYDLVKNKKNVFEIKAYNFDLYCFCKICYLLEQYIKDGSYINPVTTWYNPRTNKNNVHPGIGRYFANVILNNSKTKTLYFNTKGCLQYITSDLTPITIEEVFNKYSNFLFGFCCDHGSLIPQFSFVNHHSEILPLHNYVIDCLNKINNIKIKTNVPIDLLNRFVVDNGYEVEINFLNNYSELDIVRAVMFSLIKHQYKSDTLTIEIIK